MVNIINHQVVPKPQQVTQPTQVQLNHPLLQLNKEGCLAMQIDQTLASAGRASAQCERGRQHAL